MDLADVRLISVVAHARVQRADIVLAIPVMILASAILLALGASQAVRWQWRFTTVAMVGMAIWTWCVDRIDSYEVGRAMLMRFGLSCIVVALAVMLRLGNAHQDAYGYAAIEAPMAEQHRPLGAAAIVVLLIGGICLMKYYLLPDVLAIEFGWNK